MKRGYLSVAALLVALPVVLLMLNTVATGTLGDGRKVMLTSHTENGQVENTSDLVETDARPTAVTEPSESLVTTERSGTTLLQTHCAQCHSVKLLEQTRKTRKNWEKTLSRMEKYSDPMSDAEKYLILEYLAVPDKT